MCLQAEYFFNKRMMNDELFSFYAMTRRGQIYQNT